MLDKRELYLEHEMRSELHPISLDGYDVMDSLEVNGWFSKRDSPDGEEIVFYQHESWLHRITQNGG